MPRIRVIDLLSVVLNSKVCCRTHTDFLGCDRVIAKEVQDKDTLFKMYMLRSKPKIQSNLGLTTRAFGQTLTGR